MDEALRNIREAIDMCMEDEDTKELLKTYKPVEFGFYIITVGS